MSKCSCLNDATTLKNGLAAWFTRCHRTCDDLWIKVEDAVDKDDKSEILSTTTHFASKIRKHLELEEEILFPRLGQATGMGSQGPIGVMLMEHKQMKNLLDLIEDGARAGDGDQVLDYGDTLLMLTQQHNIKEEQVLYPMSEEALSSQWPEIHALLID